VKSQNTEFHAQERHGFYQQAAPAPHPRIASPERLIARRVALWLIALAVLTAFGVAFWFACSPTPAR
jgi:hypothetical protein